MNFSGLFVLQSPQSVWNDKRDKYTDEWIAYDGRGSEQTPEVMLDGRCSPWLSNTVCRIPIVLGKFETEADAWLCVNELQRKEKKNEDTCATGQDGDVTEQMSGEDQRCSGNTGA